MLINDKFMLRNEISYKLYDAVKNLPIFDFHCHLSPKEIAEDKPFNTINEIWLNHDHYKWRLMRANGIKEEYITGNKEEFEKFNAFANTLDNSIITPIYHWTALELKKYFGIDEILSNDNSEKLFNEINNKIKESKLSPKKIIEMSNVDVICTTDNILDNLKYHKEILKDNNFKTKVIPGFRPDELFSIGTSKFTNFIIKFEKLINKKILSYKELIDEVAKRIKYFDENGCFVSDHGIASIPYMTSTNDEIEYIYNKALNNENISNEEYEKFITRVFIDLAKEYKKYDWAVQIHFGVIRNNNSIMLEKIGTDSGFDSILDTQNVAIKFNKLLDTFSKNNSLNKLIVFNLDPTLNNVVACTLANYQVNSGLMQFGAGWWFNDTKEGMLRQIKTLADQGLISKFVGMLTDSRSLFSYVRHDYFRRILCEYIGDLVINSEIPLNLEKLEKMVQNICYYNAKQYFKKKGK